MKKHEKKIAEEINTSSAQLNEELTVSKEDMSLKTENKADLIISKEVQDPQIILEGARNRVGEELKDPKISTRRQARKNNNEARRKYNEKKAAQRANAANAANAPVQMTNEQLIELADQKWQSQYKTSPDFSFPETGPILFRPVAVNIPVIGLDGQPVKVSNKIKTRPGMKTVIQLDDDETKWPEMFNDENVEIRIDIQTLKDLDQGKLSDLWKTHPIEGKPEGYVPTQQEISRIRDAMISEKLLAAEKTQEDYDNTMLKGDATGATFRLLKQIGAWEQYRLCYLTQLYYRFIENRERTVTRGLEQVPRPAFHGSASLKGSFSYEKQGVGSNNCYACSMAGNFIHLLSKDRELRNRNGEKLDQEKIRSFTPRYLSKQELLDVDPYETNDFEKQRDDVSLFAGAGKKATGNIGAISDVIFETRENGGLERDDVAVVEGVYRLNGAFSETAVKNMIEALKAKLYEVISSGQMVSLLTNKHYVTIVGISDNNIKYLDSTSDTPNDPIDEDIDTFLKRGGRYDAVEISYFKKISPQDRQALQNEYSGLGVDPQTGEVVRKNWINKQHDAAHRAGIGICKTWQEMVDEGNGDIVQNMQETIYLSRTAFMNDAQKQAFKTKNDNGWNDAQNKWDIVLLRKEREKAQQEAENEKKRLEAEKEQAALEERIKKAEEEEQEKKKKESEYKKNLNSVFSDTDKNSFFTKYERAFNLSYRVTDKHGIRNVNDNEKTSCLKSMRLLKAFDKDLKDADIEKAMRAVVALKNENATEKEAADGTGVIEKIFLRILEFDIRGFEANDFEDMAKKMADNAAIVDFARGENDFIFDVYESLRRQNKATSINMDGLAAVRERLQIIKSYGDYYLSALKVYKDQAVIKNPLESVFVLNAEQINAKLEKLMEEPAEDKTAEKKKKPVKREIPTAVIDHYVAGLAYKNDQAEYYKNHGKDLEERKKQKLIDMLKPSVTAYDEQMKLDVKVESAKERYTEFTEKRKARMDKDAAFARPYKVLEKNAPAAGAAKEKKQEFIDAVEHFCSMVLNFDASKFKAEKGTDFYNDPDRYAACMNIVEISKKLEPLLSGNYAALAQGQEIKAAMNEDMIREVLDRIAVYKNGEEVLKTYGKLSEVPDTEAFAFEEQKAQEIRNAFAQKKDNVLAGNRNSAELKLRQARGIYTNSGSFRTVTPSSIYSLASRHTFRRGLSVTEREKKMKNPRSELYKKIALSETLSTNSIAVTGNMAKRRRAMGFSTRSMVKDEEFRALSAFFTEEGEANEKIVREFAENKTAAMDELTSGFLNIKLDGIDLSTDERLAASAGNLEEISQKLQSYKMLFDADAEYQNRLKEMNNNGNDTSVYDVVIRHMKELSAVTDYYRVRKLLLTDPYYLSHYNDEVSALYTNNDSKEQKEVSKLILLSAQCAKKMSEVFGGRAAGSQAAHPDLLAGIQHEANMSEVRGQLEMLGSPEFAEGTAAYISSLEEEHKKRAYKDGRINLDLITSEGVNGIVKELKKLRNNGALNNRDLKEYTPAYQKAEKNASPATSQILKYYHNQTQGGAMGYTQAHYGELIDKMTETAGDREKSRLNDFSSRCSFEDPHTGEKISYGSNMHRMMTPLCRMAEGEMMSNDEVLELIENLNIENMKDLDISDQKQAERAKDIYLKSMAKLYKIYYDYHMRFYNTYGMLVDQIPVPMLALAMPDHMSDLFFRFDGANMDELITGGGLSEGRRVVKGLMDLMVERGYLTPEFVAEFRKLSNHASGTSYVTTNDTIQMTMFATDQGPDELEVTEEKVFLDDITKHGNDHENVPKLNKDQQKDIWKKMRGATELPEEAFASHENTVIRAHNKEDEQVEALAKLDTYISRLSGVDTDKHSNKYIVMNNKLTELTATMRTIANRQTEDGKNVDPASLHTLRKMYGELLGAANTYLKGKNRKHKNALYRRRYDIVESMIATIEKDYSTLNGREFDKSYRLSDILTESREEMITVSEKQIRKFAGGGNERLMFTGTINGQQKKVAFTKRNRLENKNITVNRYSELSSKSDKYGAAFPDLALITSGAGRTYMDAFFRKPEIAQYIEDKLDKKVSTIKPKEFGRRFEEYLEELWKKHSSVFIEKWPNVFRPKSGNVLLGRFRELTRDGREEVVRHIESIGMDYIQEEKKLQTYAMGHIPVGSNLDMRNVAMTIVSREMGTQNVIAQSELANVHIEKEEKKEKNKEEKKGKKAKEAVKGEDGILMEWIEGVNIDQLRRKIRNGEIELDNEADLIEQLADIEATDYIDGNMDRHMDNIMIELEETGKTNDRGTKIMRVRRIVGIDNDMSGGLLKAEDVQDYISRLAPPEQMRLMSRSTANRILELNKESLFIKLGSTLTENEKECMWSRIEYLKQAIRKADTPGEKGTLRILDKDDFKKISLKELAAANGQEENIYKLFYESSRFNKERAYEQPHRYACEEQKLDMKLTKRVEYNDEDCSSSEALELGHRFLSKSSRTRRKMMADVQSSHQVYDMIVGAVYDFNKYVAKLFTKVSSNANYGDGDPRHGSADLFSNEWSRAHGINSIIDIFYIDGKPAAETLPAETENMIRQFHDTEGPDGFMLANLAQDADLKEMIAKATIMYYITSGEHQVTIANYQAKGDGEGDELVITDINPYVYSQDYLLVPYMQSEDPLGNGKMIQKSRKSRTRRFSAIRQHAEARRQQAAANGAN